MGRIWIFLIVAGAALAIKTPFALEHFRLYPDAIAYLDIARNLSDGNGFTSALKLNYFHSSGVTHCALSDWPPLYPLLAGGILTLVPNEIVLQLVNALLVGAAAGLVFLLGDKLFDRRTGLLAGLFAAIAPNLFRSGIAGMSDPLGLVLALGALMIGISAKGRPTWWAAAGVVAGAAYLARFSNAVILLAFVPFLLLERSERRNVWPCLAGFMLAAGPLLAWKWGLYGSPFHSAQMFHYRTESFRLASWNGYASTSVIDPNYLMHNMSTVAAAVWRNTLAYAGSLFVGTGGLFLLSGGLVALGVTGPRGLFTRERVLVLAVAAMHFAIYASTWSIPPVQGSRFLMVSYCLLLPFCAAGVVRALESTTAAVRVGAIGVCMVVIAVYCHACFLAAGSTHGQFEPLDASVVRWAGTALPPGTNVASNNPWMIRDATGLPSAALPWNLDREKLAEFLREYDIGAVILLASTNKSLTLETIEKERVRFGKGVSRNNEVRVEQVGSALVAVPVRQ